jgi:hypothetical protein
MEEVNSQIKSQSLLLETYLSSFAKEVVALCDREESDFSISAQETYAEIRDLWLQLKESQPEILELLPELD